MIVDITGVELVPGNFGRECPGNGLHPGVECCCDECDYFLCCFWDMECESCKDSKCPRNEKLLQNFWE